MLREHKQPEAALEATLEECLIALCKYGRPRLSRHKDGWYAEIEMHVPSEGVSFSIKTSFDEKTPSSAVSLLLSRVHETIKEVRCND